ncbi:MAG: hypothetical protein ACFFDF_08720 [Candidatus Odinarchaeota archaeon]
MSTLDLYNEFRKVPNEAQKSIAGGRLKGMTDINPMWRIKKLTEKFGPCGFGWSYEITNQWIEDGANNEKVAFTNINLYVKLNEEWSKPIQGTGGSSFIAKEKAGLYTSDECFKMSLTDAISVACKSLGIAADVYFAKDRTKYDNPQNENDNENKPKVKNDKVNNIKTFDLITKPQAQRMYAIGKGNVELIKKIMAIYGYTESRQIKKSDYENICSEIEIQIKLIS